MDTQNTSTIVKQRATRRRKGLVSEADKVRVMAYYLTTDRSLKDLCTELKLDFTSIYNTSSREGWAELRQEYRNSAIARLTNNVTNSDIDNIKQMRAADRREWQKLQDKIVYTIDNLLSYEDVKRQCIADSGYSEGSAELQVLVSKTYQDALLAGRILTGGNADRYINALFKAQQGKYRAIGLADTVNINVDMQAIAPQGVLNMVRQDGPAWLTGQTEQSKQAIPCRQTGILNKTDTSLDECQGIYGYNGQADRGGMQVNDPPPPADRQELAPCSADFPKSENLKSPDSPISCIPTKLPATPANFFKVGGYNE